jgi:aryl-alcohol dehydrogenase-like predicted oxidoreductase
MLNQVQRLVLGTVQFGLNYGINSEGKPSEIEVKKILELCKNKGLRFIDTAYVYGNSEDVIGRNWPNEASDSFKIITKLPPGTTPDTAVGQTKASLARLRQKSVYGLLFHRFSDYKTDHTAFDQVLVDLKSQRHITHYGFSLYQPEEALWLLENAQSVDIVQVPYSILDRRFEAVFKKLKDKFNTEIHVRSVFLQGLYFKSPEDLPAHLYPLKKYLIAIQRQADRHQVSLATLLLSFIFQNDLIDGILTGVDNSAQLEQNIQGLSQLIPNLSEIPVQNEHLKLLNPANW